MNESEMILFPFASPPSCFSNDLTLYHLTYLFVLLCINTTASSSHYTNEAGVWFLFPRLGVVAKRLEDPNVGLNEATGSANDANDLRFWMPLFVVGLLGGMNSRAYQDALVSCSGNHLPIISILIVVMKLREGR